MYKRQGLANKIQELHELLARFKRDVVQMCIRDSYQVVKDFLAEFNLRKVAQTFTSIRSSLDTADITERFMLLVEAATCVGLLRVGSSNETSRFFPGTQRFLVRRLSRPVSL